GAADRGHQQQPHRPRRAGDLAEGGDRRPAPRRDRPAAHRPAPARIRPGHRHGRPRRRRGCPRMKTFLPFDSRIAILLVAAIAVAGTLGALRPDVFLSALNINSMLLQSSVIGLLALAVAVTLLTGGIDLSINATANLTAIVVALFLGALAPADGGGIGFALLAVVVGLAVGLACGLFNGFIIAVLGYSPI